MPYLWLSSRRVECSLLHSHPTLAPRPQIGHIGSVGFVSVNLQKSFQHLQHSIFGIAWNDFIGGFFSFFSCCVYCISFSGRLNHRNVIQVISKSNRFFWGDSQLASYFFQGCPLSDFWHYNINPILSRSQKF